MRRRKFITLLGSAAAGWPLAAHAQQGARLRRLGVLIPYAESDAEAQSEIAAFRQTLEQLGWRDGGNLSIEYRWAIPAFPASASCSIPPRRPAEACSTAA